MTAVDLAYEVHGADHLPTVLLTGSLGSTTQMWQPQLAALSARFRLVAVATRGHGGPPVPPPPYDVEDLAADLDRVLDRLGVEQANAVGLSLGGLSVLQLAATRPHRLDRVVVLCTSARFTPAGAWVQRAHLVRDRRPRVDRASGGRAVIHGCAHSGGPTAHLANLDQPDAVTALLLDHLTGEIAREGA